MTKSRSGLKEKKIFYDRLGVNEARRLKVSTIYYAEEVEIVGDCGFAKVVVGHDRELLVVEIAPDLFAKPQVYAVDKTPIRVVAGSGYSKKGELYQFQNGGWHKVKLNAQPAGLGPQSKVKKASAHIQK